MSAFLHQLSLAAPLRAGFVGWQADACFRLAGSVCRTNPIAFVFSVAMPAMLFRMMSDLSRRRRWTRGC